MILTPQEERIIRSVLTCFDEDMGICSQIVAHAKMLFPDECHSYRSPAVTTLVQKFERLTRPIESEPGAWWFGVVGEPAATDRRLRALKALLASDYHTLAQIQIENEGHGWDG